MSFRAWLPIRTIRIGPDKRYSKTVGFSGRATFREEDFSGLGRAREERCHVEFR
jgi:hypothetical protein